VLAPEAKAEAEESQELSASPSQLSPFHHLVVLLVRFTCSNFPHLLPRVLFAEETIGPFVYWRTGGGSGSMVQAFSDLDDEPARERKPDAVPGFRAFWLSKDARVPVAEQRANLGARSASTLLYLHGGGFSLGSVAFYAESLLRLRAKVSALETERGVPIESDARFVAVEYDLAPTARFPTPLLQCLRCYAHLVEVEQIDPSCITLAGDSAGGNLTMAMLLALSGQAGDDGLLAERDWSALPMPGKAVLISPWVDLRPSHAAAFGPLRQPAKPRAEASTEKNEAASSSSPLDDYEWDYVAAEALLHFAQVYSGVLPRPRRVAGPLGWLADFCGGAGQEAEGNSEKKGSTARSGTFATPVTLEALARPGRRLARATHRVLAEPLFSQPPSTSSSNNDGPLVAQDQNSSFGGLEPLFPHSERQTDLVSSTSDLYVPIDGSASGDEDVAEAKQLLETHPLLSPSTGNWGAVRLERGMLVTWGERERLAVDIERFVERVHKLASSNNRHAAPRHDDGPAQDGDTAHASSMPEPDARAAWLQTYVESGPGGVHAWPFVNM
jgi:acetyl esterase/lipase